MRFSKSAVFEIFGKKFLKHPNVLHQIRLLVCLSCAMDKLFVWGCQNAQTHIKKVDPFVGGLSAPDLTPSKVFVFDQTLR